MHTQLLKLPLLLYLLFTVGNINAQKKDFKFIDNSPGYDIAVYYFPNYHNDDSRNELRYGKGWSEWELVKNALPRFEGHNQPKIPLWGYTNESDPRVMEMKNNKIITINSWNEWTEGSFLEPERE